MADKTYQIELTEYQIKAIACLLDSVECGDKGIGPYVESASRAIKKPLEDDGVEVSYINFGSVTRSIDSMFNETNKAAPVLGDAIVRTTPGYTFTLQDVTNETERGFYGVDKLEDDVLNVLDFSIFG